MGKLALGKRNLPILKRVKYQSIFWAKLHLLLVKIDIYLEARAAPTTSPSSRHPRCYLDPS